MNGRNEHGSYITICNHIIFSSKNFSKTLKRITFVWMPHHQYFLTKCFRTLFLNHMIWSISVHSPLSLSSSYHRFLSSIDLTIALTLLSPLHLSYRLSFSLPSLSLSESRLSPFSSRHRSRLPPHFEPTSLLTTLLKLMVHIFRMARSQIQTSFPPGVSSLPLSFITIMPNHMIILVSCIHFQLQVHPRPFSSFCFVFTHSSR